MRSRLDAVLLFSLVFLGAGSLAGCPAVYPELGTRMRPVPAGIALDPPPPGDLRWMRILSARVPARTRDGRSWQMSGKLADPYAKLLVNEREIIKTPVQSNTLEPTWPDGPKGNFRIAPGDKLRIELWDNSPLNDKPIGVKDLRITDEHLQGSELRVELDGGAEMVIAFEPAHAVQGAGLWYELRTDSCFVSRLLEQSPAERAGIVAGDQILAIGGRDTKAMTTDEIKSAFNAIPLQGLELVVKHADNKTLTLTLKEGPIYPEFSQYGPVD